MNSFAIIFGHCVWVPPSAKAALVSLMLFYGVGVQGRADADGYEAEIAQQYISAGKTAEQASREIAVLEACFGTYEPPSDKRRKSSRSE